MMRIRRLALWLGITLVPLTMIGILWLFLAGDGPMHSERATLKGNQVFYSLAFSPDSKLLAGGQQDGTITIWEAETGKEVLTVPRHPVSVYGVYALAFSPDGRILAWGSGDNSVTLFDLAAKEVKV